MGSGVNGTSSEWRLSSVLRYLRLARNSLTRATLALSTRARKASEPTTEEEGGTSTPIDGGRTGEGEEGEAKKGERGTPVNSVQQWEGEAAIETCSSSSSSSSSSSRGSPWHR